MPRLQIHDRRERALVAAADRALVLGAAVTRVFRRRRPPVAPKRILLLRLERIGDLLMALPAIADVRAFAPGAAVDLVVGSWNEELARAIEPVTSVDTLDAAWLAREGGGLGLAALVGAARRWRSVPYDLAINFEPDIRSNLLTAWSNATWTGGYRSGGGGALLDVALEYDRAAHTTDNARRLVATLFSHTRGELHSGPAARDAGTQAEMRPILVVPAEARANASRLLRDAKEPLVGVHLSGGRPIKQWPPERFADVARRVIESTGGTIVLTGTQADRSLVNTVARELPPSHTIDVAGHLDLLALSAILERLDLLITGDTGPMHLAAAVATPIVAVFGPSDPARYAPRGPLDRVVRVDLPCSPCNRIRRPPARCTGHTPDCLAFLTADDVFSAAMTVLQESRRRAAVHADPATA